MAEIDRLARLADRPLRRPRPRARPARAGPTGARSAKRSPTGSTPPRRSWTRSSPSRTGRNAPPPHADRDSRAAGGGGGRHGRPRPSRRGGRPGRDRQDHHHRQRRPPPPQPRPAGHRTRARRARPPTCSPPKPAARPTPSPGSSPATATGRRRWPAGTTVVLDEAGMTATDDLAELVALVRQHRWRLVAVGDPAQLPAVGRGGVFAHWCDTVPHHRAGHAPPVPSTPGKPTPASLLRAGDPAAVERLRRPPPAPHRPPRRSSPARSPGSTGATPTQGRSVAITTNTAETARAINLAIQRRQPTDRRTPGPARRRHHRPGRRPDRHPPQRPHAASPTVARRSATATPGPSPPSTCDGDAHRRPPRQGHRRAPRRLRRASTSSSGWAVTGYGNQGDTVDAGIAVLEPGTTRNHAYVALTRGRHTNLALIPDPTGTTDPAQTLTEMISRTPSLDSALATRTRLHQEAGIPEPPLQPNDPIDTDLAARADDIQRRLDALQQRPGGRSLGL